MDMQWISRSHFRIRTASGRLLDTAARPLVMGILNVTPDSFSDGGDYFRIDRAVAHGRDMVLQGAYILDIGGESTRPGAAPVDAETEKKRVLPVISELAAESDVPMSIDTRKAAVAEAALEAGAEMINDVSALRYDKNMASVAASSGAALCLMHMQGEPRTMQGNPQYGDVVGDVMVWLRERVDAALDAGVDVDGIIVDPGFGFGKLPAHNLELLCRLSELNAIGRPVLLGASRKSTIGAVLGRGAECRLYGSLAVAAAAVLSGVSILRVHDVGASLDAVRMAEAIRRGGEWVK